jgi:HEPN domain-containing protein
MAKQTNTPKEWRLLAERDWAIAEHLSVNMSPVPTEVVAFFCQQTTEKYLKGALVIMGEEPPYTHDLPELCKLAEKPHPSFADISSLCSIITQFSVQPRYDLGLSLSEEDMQLVLAHTKTIREFLQNEIPEFFQDEDKKKT